VGDYEMLVDYARHIYRVYLKDKSSTILLLDHLHYSNQVYKTSFPYAGVDILLDVRADEPATAPAILYDYNRGS